MNQQTTYLGQRSSCSKLIIPTHRHTDSRPIALPGPLKWPVTSKEQSYGVDFERSGTVVVELSRAVVSLRVVNKKESSDHRRTARVQHEETDSCQSFDDACVQLTSISPRKVSRLRAKTEIIHQGRPPVSSLIRGSRPRFSVHAA